MRCNTNPTQDQESQVLEVEMQEKLEVVCQEILITPKDLTKAIKVRTQLSSSNKEKLNAFLRNNA